MKVITLWKLQLIIVSCILHCKLPCMYKTFSVRVPPLLILYHSCAYMHMSYLQVHTYHAHYSDSFLLVKYNTVFKNTSCAIINILVILVVVNEVILYSSIMQMHYKYTTGIQSVSYS